MFGFLVHSPIFISRHMSKIRNITRTIFCTKMNIYANHNFYVTILLLVMKMVNQRASSSIREYISLFHEWIKKTSLNRLHCQRTHYYPAQPAPYIWNIFQNVGGRFIRFAIGHCQQCNVQDLWNRIHFKRVPLEAHEIS